MKIMVVASGQTCGKSFRTQQTVIELLRSTGHEVIVARPEDLAQHRGRELEFISFDEQTPVPQGLL